MLFSPNLVRYIINFLSHWSSKWRLQMPTIDVAQWTCAVSNLGFIYIYGFTHLLFIYLFIYLFITFGGNQANPNSADALNLRDASMKCLETDLFKKSSFRCRRENRRTRRKPAEASMDWKPNAHTAPGLGIEPGPIGA